MAISLSLSAKSNITLSKEAKSSSFIWDDADWSWNSVNSPWSNPALTLNKGETKSNITLSKKSK